MLDEKNYQVMLSGATWWNHIFVTCITCQSAWRIEWNSTVTRNIMGWGQMDIREDEWDGDEMNMGMGDKMIIKYINRKNITMGNI